jgi:hypothetical protein
VGVEEGPQLRAGIGLRLNAVADVGPVEGGEEDLALLQRQPLHDLAAGGTVRRGGEREARHAGEALVQDRELAVFGAEIMPPLGHAVRLVDGEQGDARTVQQGQEAVGQKPLGRHIEQVEVAHGERPLHLPRLAGGQRGIEHGRLHAQLAQGLHLIVHQRDERRHDDGGAGPNQGRHLIAQGLAATRGHQHQGIAARRHVFHDLLLMPAKGLVAEDMAQDAERIGIRGSFKGGHGAL